MGRQHLGEMPPYTLVNLSSGLERDGTQVSVLVNNVFNVLGEIDALLGRVRRPRLISRT